MLINLHSIMIKKVLITLFAGIVVLFGVLLFNSLTAEKYQLDDIPKKPAPMFDHSHALDRFATSLTFETVSIAGGPVNEPAFSQFHQFLEASFPLVFEKLELERVNEWTLLFTWHGRNADLEPVMLMAHQDVVPAGDLDAWLHPPFAGVIEDGKVWGRGAIDNKNGVMAILEAVELRLRDGLHPERTIMLLFGHDEEISGVDGAKATAELLERRGIRLQMVLDEGGYIIQGGLPVDRPTALVGTSEKGYLDLELKAFSQGGHSSSPPVDTPIFLLAEALHKLNRAPFKASVSGASEDMFAFLTPEMPFVERMIFSNLWLTKPLVLGIFKNNPQASAMLKTTIAPTMMSGSQAPNVLPAEASVVINFRIQPGETIDSVKEHVIRVINDDRIQVSAYAGAGTNPSPISDARASAFSVLHKSIREVFDSIYVAPFLMIAATDSRHLTLVSDNVFRFSPVQLTTEEAASFHAVNEHLHGDTYLKMIHFYYNLLEHVTTTF